MQKGRKGKIGRRDIQSYFVVILKEGAGGSLTDDKVALVPELRFKDSGAATARESLARDMASGSNPKNYRDSYTRVGELSQDITDANASWPKLGYRRTFMACSKFARSNRDSKFVFVRY